MFQIENLYFEEETANIKKIKSFWSSRPAFLNINAFLFFVENRKAQKIVIPVNLRLQK